MLCCDVELWLSCLFFPESAFISTKHCISALWNPHWIWRNYVLASNLFSWNTMWCWRHSPVTPLDNKFACLISLEYSVVSKNRSGKPYLPQFIICFMPMIIAFIMALVNELIRLGWITWLANSYWNDSPRLTLLHYYKMWQDRPAQPLRQMFICNAALRRWGDESKLFQQLSLPCQQFGGGAASGAAGIWDSGTCFHSGVSRDDGPAHVLVGVLCGDPEAVVAHQETLGHRCGTALPVWAHASNSLSPGHQLLSEAHPSYWCAHHGVLPGGNHL